ncbi:hypothetical protein SBA3_3080003 [Candidatus Sulfopaludibacter sp. SbA3]|nr:hypothetical protein SBA3_3080003 [Candidatus Sulfopaludibacter sp. SbA3]
MVDAGLIHCKGAVITNASVRIAVSLVQSPPDPAAPGNLALTGNGLPGNVRTASSVSDTRRKAGVEEHADGLAPGGSGRSALS